MMSPGLADVVISIATMNSHERLRACLESIPAACSGLRWTTVVVDNCSSDGTSEMVRRDFPTAQLIINTVPLGFGANHNQVLRPIMATASRPAYVLILNDDTQLHAGSVAALVGSATTEARPGAVVPRVLDAGGHREPVAFRRSSPWAVPARILLGRPRIKEQPLDATWLNGCCMLCSVTALSDVGLFDEQFFMYCEDVDLTLRLRRRGYRLWQCQAAAVTHFGQGTTGRAHLARPMQLQRARSYYQLLTKLHGRGFALALTSLGRGAHAAQAGRHLLLALPSRDNSRWERSRHSWAQARYAPHRAVFPDRERPETDS